MNSLKFNNISNETAYIEIPNTTQINNSYCTIKEETKTRSNNISKRTLRINEDKENIPYYKNLATPRLNPSRFVTQKLDLGQRLMNASRGLNVFKKTNIEQTFRIAPYNSIVSFPIYEGQSVSKQNGSSQKFGYRVTKTQAERTTDYFLLEYKKNLGVSAADLTERVNEIEKNKFLMQRKPSRLIVQKPVVIETSGRRNVGFVAPYCDGGTLENQVAANLDDSTKVQLAIKLSKAVQELHSFNIVHRDIKPDNVLIKESEGQMTPFLTDFGKSLFLEEAPNKITCLALSWASKKVVKKNDPRQDIYSLGVTFYQLFTGTPSTQLAFVHDKERAMNDTLSIRKDFSNWTGLDTLPLPVQALIEKMCAAKLQDRYQNMDEVIKALGDIEQNI